MDRSFLSNKDVIAASRDYVCIRLATYEDADEAEFLKTIYLGRSGELENTVFVLLSPDTKTNLCRPGRGPHFAYPTPSKLAKGMQEIAKSYPTKTRDAASTPLLPQMKDFRLGLNVSSCDGLPTVVCVSDDAEQRKELNAKLAGLAFEDKLAGKFGFASASLEDMKVIEGYQLETGFVIVQPGEFGLDGRMMEAFDADVELSRLQKNLVRFASQTNLASKSNRSHVSKGQSIGKTWTTEIPVTDPGSLKAMERARSRSKK